MTLRMYGRSSGWGSSIDVKGLKHENSTELQSHDLLVPVCGAPRSVGAQSHDLLGLGTFNFDLSFVTSVVKLATDSPMTLYPIDLLQRHSSCCRQDGSQLLKVGFILG